VSETIVLQRDSATNPIGWTASGAFADSGSWTDPFAAFGGCLDQTPVCEGLLKTVETSASGTFQIVFQVHFNAITNPSLSGTWKISQGSGAYSTLAGTGTWSRSSDPSTGVLTFTCIGSVHFN